MKSLRIQASLGHDPQPQPFSRAAAANVISIRFSNWSTGNSEIVGREHAGVELGNIQERIEQLVHRADRGIDLLDETRLLGLIGLAAQLRDEQVQGMQRLPQIVARRRQKARLGEVGGLKLLIEMPELFGHPVDVGRQGAQLVPIDDINALRKIAGRDLIEPRPDLGDRSDQRPRNGITEHQGQHDAAGREAHHDPLRRDVGLIAQFDSRYHVGFGLVDQLVGETLEAVGQRHRLCQLQLARLGGAAGADQFHDLRHEVREPLMVLPKPVKQFDLVLGHELQSIECYSRTD